MFIGFYNITPRLISRYRFNMAIKKETMDSLDFSKIETNCANLLDIGYDEEKQIVVPERDIRVFQFDGSDCIIKIHITKEQQPHVGKIDLFKPWDIIFNDLYSIKVSGGKVLIMFDYVKPNEIPDLNGYLEDIMECVNTN